MRRLGALLAGGRSRRFGSDKAEALVKGRSLIDHGVTALKSQCRDIIIVGRQTSEFDWAEDWPAPGMGPLGGIAGALRYAAIQGFDEVFSIPIDCVFLPPNIGQLLEPSPSCLASQPVIGLWPLDVLPDLEEILRGDGDMSVRSFAKRIGARRVESAFQPPNINSQADLERLTRSLA